MTHSHRNDPKGPPLVTTASPVLQRRQSLPSRHGSASRFSANKSPPALVMAPSTPPPPWQPSFAAFTRAPTWASSTLPFDTTSSPYFNACLASGSRLSTRRGRRLFGGDASSPDDASLVGSA